MDAFGDENAGRNPVATAHESGHGVGIGVMASGNVDGLAGGGG